MLRLDFCSSCRQCTRGNTSQLNRPLQIQDVSLKMIQGNSSQSKYTESTRKSFDIGWPCWHGSVCKCPSAGEFGTPGLRCGPGASSSGWWWRLSPLYNGSLLASICMTEKVNPCQKVFYPWASSWKEGILKYFWLYQSEESFLDRAAENLNDSTTVVTVAEIMIKLVLLTLLQ